MLPAGTRSEYLVADAVGNIFTTSGFNIFKITPWGTVTTVGTLPGGFGIAPDLAIDKAGNVYVNQYQYVVKFPGMGVAFPGPKPVVTTVSPAAAQAGASVVITGTNLSGATSVKFGTVPSPYFQSIAFNKLMAVVPAGAPMAKVTVATAAGSSTTTNVFRRLAPPTQVDAGVGHACARLSDGNASCWGLGSSGQLGNNSTATSKVPILVPGLAGVAQVAAGGAFSCARLSSGQIKCWGANANGQLGHGNVLGSKVPVSVYAKGSTPLTGVASVSAGSNFACAVVSPGANGTVRCWGGNAKGQLGDGSVVQRTRPVTVLTAPGVALRGVASVDAGGSSACATLTNGAVRCWGGNAHGQLGRGNLVGSKYAVAVTGINGVAAKAKRLSVGLDHACVVLTTGGVRCWGANASGQLGDGSTTQRTNPVGTKVSAAAALTGATAIAAGGAHTCAIVGAGSAARVRCWGSDATGQLGNTATGVQRYAVVVAGSAANGATSISVAVGYSAVVAPSAGPSPVAIVDWGTNTTYQLGDGTASQHPTPVVNPVI
jgi:alpha-tubulin suppressor-like RCC1 family protein